MILHVKYKRFLIFHLSLHFSFGKMEEVVICLPWHTCNLHQKCQVMFLSCVLLCCSLSTFVRQHGTSTPPTVWPYGRQHPRCAKERTIPCTRKKPKSSTLKVTNCWIREAIKIWKWVPRTINRDNGAYSLSHTWDAILNKASDIRVSLPVDWRTWIKQQIKQQSRTRHESMSTTFSVLRNEKWTLKCYTMKTLWTY